MILGICGAWLLLALSVLWRPCVLAPFGSCARRAPQRRTRPQGGPRAAEGSTAWPAHFVETQRERLRRRLGPVVGASYARATACSMWKPRWARETARGPWFALAAALARCGAVLVVRDAEGWAGR